MAIRFACPSCQQPIEVDDNWGGQSVACPYCRHVVTAPRESRWPPGDIPVASPARSAFSPPPPPTGTSGVPPQLPGTEHRTDVQPRPSGPSSAGWALLLAVTSALLSVIGTLIWFYGLFEAVTRKVGMNASQEEMKKAIQELMLSGAAPVSPGAIAAMLIGVFFGVAALVLAIRSLVSSEEHRVKAVAACLIAAGFVVCQGMLITGMLQQRAGAA